jgi:uncharacterized membrane protein (DUF106 family)
VNTLLIFLTQTMIGATVEILSLLLVAVIIGYITAWRYYKSVYEGRIKVIESEKDELNNHIFNLNEDKNKLNKSLQEKDNETENLNKNLREKNIETEQLIMEVNALKKLNAVAVNEIEDYLITKVLEQPQRLKRMT